MPKRKSFEDYLPELLRVHGSALTFLKLTGTKTSSGKPVIRCVCPVHGEFDAAVPLLLNGGGCAKCWADRRVGLRRLSSLEWLAKFREVYGETYVYTGVTYENSQAMVDYFCEHHGYVRQLAQTHLRGKGCPDCVKSARGIDRRTSEAGWLNKFYKSHRDTYTYLSVSYGVGTSSEPIVSYLCPTHGPVTQSAKNHANGHGCPACGASKRAFLSTFTLSDWAARFRATHGTNYEYLDVIKDVGKPSQVLYLCRTHGHVLQSASDHADGHGCKSCVPSGTFGNNHTAEIAEYLESLGLATAREHLFAGSRKRWDVAVPDAKIVIEFDGVYYHSEKFKSDRAYMKSKAEEAAVNGFRQINIWEDEWSDKKEIVKRLLASAVGRRSDRRIYGRNLKVSNVDSATAKIFMEANHIQGFVPGSNYIALTDGTEVVACMIYSYRVGGRSTKLSPDCVEVQRYATSSTVVGGFQKLLKVLLADVNVTAVVSYSDPRLFTGSMYAKAGFVCLGEGGPDYCYVKSRRRISKRARQKSWYRSNPSALYDPTLTEYELAKLNGYHRLWTRGKVKWLLTVQR